MLTVSKYSYLVTLDHSEKYSNISKRLIISHEKRIFRQESHVLSAPMFHAVCRMPRYICGSMKRSLLKRSDLEFELYDYMRAMISRINSVILQIYVSREFTYAYYVGVSNVSF